MSSDSLKSITNEVVVPKAGESTIEASTQRLEVTDIVLLKKSKSLAHIKNEPNISLG